MAVDHVDFAVEEGEILGLLGPNGARKTTIINRLRPILKPTTSNAMVWRYELHAQMPAKWSIQTHSRKAYREVKVHFGG